ncbi:stealth family protein [Microbacterium betulae]|uniref:Stealth family protein n=1 Tax=Microbacterium betulae TaxID=2981139 RepID=A0AA97I815_9MICO|nr:stealth family protein [Microbacterium sp. AB]WOF24212.1 stealth family protein [Microbacterium sp. AB]
MTLLGSSPAPHARDAWPGAPDPAHTRLHDGIPHLVEETTPEHAQTADLLALARIFEDAALRPLLVRRTSGGPALALDVREKDAALRALTADGGLWAAARTAGRPAHLLVTGAEDAFEKDAAIVFRPRITPSGTLRHGAETGVRVEFWRHEDGLVRAPRRNALTRRTIMAEDLSFATVRRHGRSWRTLDGMFAPGPHEVAFDVDIVFSWVDGSSDDFQRERAKRLNAYVVGDGDAHAARFRQVDELRYALRSVHLFAPWIRRIYIATDSPAPRWLVDHPKVRIVRSEEFFADPSVLPTHNSHAVEAQLHRIPGIAEHFLYSNDDMFFGRPVRPELFFTPAGLTKFVECGVRIGVGPARASRSGHDNAARVNRDLLRERFGRIITRDLQHCATPHSREVMGELEREFPDEFARTTAARFRSATDVSVTNSLYHYYAAMTGRALPTREPRTRYIQTTLRNAPARLGRLLERRDADMFCLNDGSVPEIPEELREHVVRETLEAYFPVRAPWERDESALSRRWPEAPSAGEGHPSAPSKAG